MSKRQQNVGITGKKPDSPLKGVTIPKPLYDALIFFRNNNELAYAKKDLHNMLIFTLHENSLEGIIYSEMAELTFEIEELLETLFSNIPGEFDHLEMNTKIA